MDQAHAQRRMRSGPTQLSGRPEIEPDSCFSLTICSYCDEGVVIASQGEIDNKQIAHFLLISEEVVPARVNIS